MALRDTLIATGAATGIAIISAVASSAWTASALKTRVDQHDRAFENQRTELNGMHQREQTLADGLVGARGSIDVMTAKIDGKMALLDSNLQHIRDTVDEIRGVQKKHPASLNGSDQ
jgi:septal ring factor EnvC (AmiA/AmiB activator)